MNIEELKSSSHSIKKKAKLCNWISSSFESFPTSQDHDSTTKKRKFLKHSSIELPKPDTSSTWLHRYAPRNVEELAVHKKKVAEVESWLTQHISARKGGAPILLLNGPSGCGKTSTLLLVARKHGIHVEEWSNPLTIPFNITKKAGLNYESQTTRFEDFLFRSGKYTSVLLGKEEDLKVSRKIILLEEFPNFIFQDPPCICDLLRRYRSTQRWPLVLIISDGATSDPIKKHLRELKNSTTVINFNPISATLMAKALNRISLSENRSLSKDEVTMMSSTGDVRAAINSLQFSSQSESLSELARKSGKLRKSKSSTESVGAKDTTLILFRALGKIFYCKREKRSEEKKQRRDETYRDPLVVQPEDILDQCCLSGSAFSLFLHHNYLAFNDSNPIEDVTTASEYLSLSDMMNSPLTSSDPSSGALSHLDRYEGVLASRGLIYANSKRATSEACASSSGTWRPIHKPSWYEVKRKEQENRINSHRLFWKQGDALPCLVHLASKFDPPQRNFLREVMAFPNWRTFRSYDDRLSDQVGNDINEVRDDAMTGGDVIAKVESLDVEDDDVRIEEFSD